MKNKIGWCDMTFNPVWGCRNNCPYCYARAIAKRFWKQRYEEELQYYMKKHPDWVWTGEYLMGLEDFKPTFLHSQFSKKFPKKPQRIFIGSMSEIAHWRKEWIEKVIEKVKQYPQHTFQFLTKFPEIYSDWVFPENCWLGVTVTKKNDIDKEKGLYNLSGSHLFKKIFISFEPLLEEIDPNDYNFFWDLDWVIIGAETGSRKGKVIPKVEWINDIGRYCRKNNIPIYLKDSIYPKIYPEEIKEFPI